jgi:phage terminase small subunit
MEFTPTQKEILRTVFRQMDQELGIKPLTEEQMKALKLEEEDEDNQQV